MEFEDSLLQSSIVGIGTLVLDCTLCGSVITQISEGHMILAHSILSSQLQMKWQVLMAQLL